MSSVEAKRDLPCVGKMKIVAPKPVSHSIPALGDNSFPTPNSTLLPSQETVSAPSYRMLCVGTNLDVALAQTDDFSEKVKSKITGEVDSNLRKNCEALAVEALSEHGPHVDVIAPVEVVKQIFRTPYTTSSRVSVLIQRVGKTLILNPGFDSEEHNNFEDGDKYKHRLLNFLIQSKMETCGGCEKQRTSGSNGFSRVVDCQFDKFRMRLGSDPVLFSNQNGSAIRLHLSDLNKQVSPLTWLEVWLDNCMESVPALAIGYHHDGLVDGYEFFKTEAIFGMFGDDEQAFDPEVVRRNGVEVLKFLQSTCKEEDPGVYWLCKSAGEDMFQLFNLSTNHSSRMPQPSLISSCRSDLASLLYRVSHRLVKSSSVSQAPAPLVSLKLAAVDHVSQAIKSLAKTTQHPTSEQEDRNLCLLLGESYLSLGEAYNEVGELQQALTNVELACSVYGSMPQNNNKSDEEEERSFVSAMSDSFPLQLNPKKFDELIMVKRPNSLQLVEAKPEPSYSCFNNLSPRCLFWAKVWLLVGEIHVKFHFHQLPVKPLETSSQVAEEVEKLMKKLTLHTKKCASCSLASCTCAHEDKKLKEKLPSGEDRGGIFKYLKISSEVDAESNLLAALSCFEETLGALHELPRSCEEIRSVFKRKASLWSEIGRSRFERKKNKEAEEAFGHAVLALKESCKHVEAIKINRNLGCRRLKQAESIYAMLESVRNVEMAYKKALEAATLQYIASIEFLKAAQEDYSIAIVQGLVVPENVKVDFYKLLGYVYVRLGTVLYKENTTAGQLSAVEAIEKGLAVYKSLGGDVNGQMATAYGALAESHRASYVRCLKLERQVSRKAKNHASLAKENWEKALELFRSEKLHKDFLIFLTRRSVFCLDLPEGKKYHSLKSELSSLLEARHISNADEELLEGEHIKGFWDQVQKVLKEMAILTEAAPNGEKLISLCKQSLKDSKRLSDLNEMHALWTSKS